MSIKNDWTSLLLIVFMLIGVVYFGTESKPTEMGLVIVASAIALSFANINRIQKFKGAGFEAEMKGAEKLVTKTSEIDGEVKTFGNPDRFKLLFKAQGKGWKKSTKAIEVENGCIVQVTTERTNVSGEWVSSEAVTFAPGVKLKSVDNNLFELV